MPGSDNCWESVYGQKGDTIGRIIRNGKERYQRQGQYIKNPEARSKNGLSPTKRISSNRMWMWMKEGRGHGRKQQEAHLG